MIDAPELTWKANSNGDVDVLSGNRHIGRIASVAGMSGHYAWEITGVQVDTALGKANSLSNAKRQLARYWSSWRSEAKLEPKVIAP